MKRILNKKASYYLAIIGVSFWGIVALASTTLLNDDFDGNAVNTSLWNVDSPQYLNVSGGLLQIAGGGSAHKRIFSKDKFAPNGQIVTATANVSLNGDYQKFGFNVNGSPPGRGFWFDTRSSVDGGQSDFVLAKVWTRLPDGTVTEDLVQQIPVSWNSFHEFKIEWTTSNVTFFIDNMAVANIYNSDTTQLNVGVFNDRGGVMKIDNVVVEGTLTDQDGEMDTHHLMIVMKLIRISIQLL